MNKNPASEEETLAVQSPTIGRHANAGYIHDVDWSATALGPVDSWSDILLSSVNTILAAPIPMQLFWGPDFLCIYNEAMSPALAEKHPGALGQSARVVWQEAWGTIGPQMEQVLATGTAISFGNALVPIRRNGKLEDRYWAYSYSPVMDHLGNVVGVLDVAQDITELVQAKASEQADQLTDRRLAEFTKTTNDVLFEMNADWTVMAPLEGKGFLSNSSEPNAHWLREYIVPEDRAAVANAIQRAVGRSSLYELEHRVFRHDGTVAWILSRAVPLADEKGEVTRWLGAARDITERKFNEEALAAGRLELRLALDAASLAAWYYDPERNVVGGDEHMRRLFGLTVSEGPAESWLAPIVEEDRARVGAEFASALAGAPYNTEYRVCVNGDVCWVRAKAKLVDWIDGTKRMLGTCEDFTDRKRVESALRETVERLALAQEMGHIAAWEWNAHDQEIIWDAAAVRVYGRSSDELTTLEDLYRCVHEEDLPVFRANLEAALAGKSDFTVEYRVCWPDGSHHWLVGRGRTVANERDGLARLNAVNIDITDQRTAELALRQSEKLAAVGRLASTIAHEINNPLEAVTNLLYLAKATTSAQEPLGYLDKAEVELRRVTAIANQTLRFHRQQSARSEITCVDLFTNALLIFQGRIENAGILVQRRKRAERAVNCLEGEIRQVMNNLIGNAIDAMPQGGRLLVRSAEGTDWKTGRKGLVLTVADTGKGMSRKTLRKIFEPFFSTKGIGGTGLGLWISQEIVQRHQGRLSVRSTDRSGQSGSVFRLFLPFVYPAVVLRGE